VALALDRVPMAFWGRRFGTFSRSRGWCTLFGKVGRSLHGKVFSQAPRCGRE
jgi:hypothetical protein